MADIRLFVLNAYKEAHEALAIKLARVLQALDGDYGAHKECSLVAPSSNTQARFSDTTVSTFRTMSDSSDDELLLLDSVLPKILIGKRKRGEGTGVHEINNYPKLLGGFCIQLISESRHPFD